MPTTPEVSVALPAYQHAAYVGRAVESVLAQTMSSLEVIVVDDGSTDGTADVVAAIKDSRVRLVRLRANRIDHARNVAVALSTGRFIAFQNSDDVWAPTKLEKQLRQLTEQPNIGVSFTATEWIEANGSPYAAKSVFCDGSVTRNSGDWLRELAFKNHFCVSSALMRREIWQKVGPFRHTLRQVSDWDMWVRCAALTELAVVPQMLTQMRIVGSQNLSAPNVETNLIVQCEWAELMATYLKPPVVHRLAEIFQHLTPIRDAPNQAVRSAEFACWVASHGEFCARLFADRALGELLDGAETRQHLLDRYGGQIMHFFWSNRAAIATAPVPGVR